MAKKKRQLRLLLLLLAVAVALFVAAFCWNRWQTAQEEAEAEAAVIHVDLVEEPTKLRYSNGTDTITFEKSGESWVSAEETDFPVNSDTVDTFVDTLTSLTAEREISVKDDLSAYGLETVGGADRQGRKQCDPLSGQRFWGAVLRPEEGRGDHLHHLLGRTESAQSGSLRLGLFGAVPHSVQQQSPVGDAGRENDQ